MTALLRRIHEAKVSGRETVEVWGMGMPGASSFRVDDDADAAVFPPRDYEGETGKDITVRALADLIAEAIGWDRTLELNGDMPDGMPRKLLDVSRLGSLGWKACEDLRDGLVETCRWYVGFLG
jgi:GDP-L-fucose synthase